MRSITVSLLELEDGFTNGFEELIYYLDLHTGKVVLVTESDRSLLDDAWENLDDDTMLEEGLLRQFLEEVNLPDWQVASVLEAMPVDLDSDDRFRLIPRQSSREGYSDMEEFVDSLGGSHLADLLEVAIQGKGAFRHFKDVLGDYPAQRQAWFAFEQERQRQRMLTWLGSLDAQIDVIE